MIRLYDSPQDIPQAGWLDRSRKATAKLAAARAPLAHAVARVRAAQRGVEEAESNAVEEFNRSRALVANPLASQVHPSIAVWIEKALSDAGIVDLTAPISELPSLGDLKRRISASARKELATAEAELAEIEGRKARYDLLVAEAHNAIAAPVNLPEPDESEPVTEGGLPKRRPGRPRLSDED